MMVYWILPGKHYAITFIKRSTYILPMEFKLCHSRKSKEAACCSHFTSLTRSTQPPWLH